MPFDLASAKPVAAGPPQTPAAAPDAAELAPRAGFDLATAKPVAAPAAQVSAPTPTRFTDPYAGYTREVREAGTPEDRAKFAGEMRGQAHDFVTSIPAGVNRGVIAIPGMLGDVPANVTDLGGMAYGTIRSLITGERPDTIYQPINRAEQPLTSENITKNLDAALRRIGGGSAFENPNDTPAGRLGFNVGASVPGAATARGVAANVAGGAAQGVVSELGGDPAMQAAASLVGNRVGTRRQTQPQPRQAAPAAPVAETPAAPLTASGAPRVLPGEPSAPVATPAPELTATGPARAPAYTDLEGATTSRKAPRFTEETPTAHDGARLGMGDQARRRDILRRVGVGELRNSAVEGDAKSASTDFQMSKLDNPQGQHMSRVLTAEREAVANFAERLASETGGTRGLGQTENLQRGTNIISPLDGIKDHFDNRIKALYKVADERAKGKPFDTRALRDVMREDSAFIGTVEGKHLLEGTKARMADLKMVGPDGTPKRTTVAEAERLKQYLGDQWTPRTSRLIKRLKESIDDDVFSAAGEDVYARARATRAERSRILDDPQGIAKIMDAEGPQDINRAVAVERIPDVITTLPVAQFSHIVKTLNEAPAELRDPAQAALAEIKSQFANKVADIGNKTATQWNARGVSKYLNDNSARLRVIFTPAELRRFADLNDAGHILRFDSSYPGAAVQAHNLKRAAAVEHGATAAGIGVGTFVGGPFGGVVGGSVGKVVGDKVGKGMRDRAGLKAAQARTTDLRTEPGNALGRPSSENQNRLGGS